MELTRSFLHANTARLRQLLAHPEPVRTVDYWTRDELWCDARLLWLPRDAHLDAFSAFVYLWRTFVEGVEEFELDGNHVDVLLCSLDANTGYGGVAAFTPLAEQMWFTEIARITEGICKCIAEVRSGERLNAGRRVVIPDGPLDPNNRDSYWGVFVDGERIADERSFQSPLRGSFVDGVVLRAEWNDVELFAETTTEYALFSWGTSA